MAREQHGMRRSAEYKCWAGIKQRCTNPKHALRPTVGRMSARKLSDDDVTKMRALAERGWNGKSLAAIFRVSHSAACRVISGRSFDRAIALAEAENA